MAIDINKRVEKVGIVLDKRNLTNIECEVKLGIDRSGSMDGLYRNGTVQDVVERILAISIKVDRDGTVDVWAFNDESYPVEPVTQAIMENYVNREIVKKVSSGGTAYAPTFNDILSSSKGSKGFFGFGKKEDEPTLAIFITDGENMDETAAERVIVEASKHKIYWLLVGIGNERFNFIKKLGDKYPNVGFVPISDISAIDDEDLYEMLLNEELAEWFKKF